MSNNTVNQNLSLLSQFFKHLGRGDLKFYRTRVVPYENNKPLNMDYFKKMLDFFGEQKELETDKKVLWVRNYVLFSLLFLTGNRISAVLNLTHKDVYLNGGKWFYKATVKGGYTLDRLFPETLLDDLHWLKMAEQKTNNDYIFTSRGNHKLSNPAVNKIFTRYYRLVNRINDRPHVHQIRALAGFMYYKQTSDILKCRIFMNHKSLATTDIYLNKIQEKEVAGYKELEKCLT